MFTRRLDERWVGQSLNMGDPRLATAEHGNAILERCVEVGLKLNSSPRASSRARGEGARLKSGPDEGARDGSIGSVVNARLVVPEIGVLSGGFSIRDGRIHDLWPGEHADTGAGAVLDAGGRYVLPGSSIRTCTGDCCRHSGRVFVASRRTPREEA